MTRGHGWTSWDSWGKVSWMPQPDALGLAARQAVDEHDGDIGIAAGAPQRARPERTWHRTG